MPTTAPPSDEHRFLAYAQGRDPAALEDLLRAHAGSASLQARRLLGSDADADDAVQEAFLQLARTAGRYTAAIPFRAWLGRLVHVAALRVRRADRRRRHHHRASTQHRADAPVDEAPDHEHVRRAVAALPERLRAPIDLHYFAGLTQAETALALGISENAAAVRIHRGRARLRAALRATLADDPAVALAALVQGTAALPQSAMVHATTIARWAAAGALPRTTLHRGLRSHLRAVAAQHPVALGTAVAGLTAILLVGWHASLSGAAPDSRADRTLSPGAATHAAAGGPAPWWQGRAGALLPSVDPDAMFRWGLDLASFRSAALASPPLAMLRDPRMATTVAHVRQELALWIARSDPHIPILAWLAQAQGVVASVRVDGGPGAQTTALLVGDAGEAAASVRPFLDRAVVEERAAQATRNPQLARFTPTIVGPFTGDALGPTFIGYAGDRVVIGDLPALRHALQAPTTPPPRWRAAPWWVEFQLARLFAELPHDGDLASRLLPGWAAMTPTLTTSITPEADGWHGVATLSGARRPHLGTLGPISTGVLASSSLGGIGIAFATGEDLGAALRLATHGTPLERMLSALPPHLTGEIAIRVDQAAGVPQISIVCPLRSSQDAAALVGQLQPMMAAVGAAWSTAAAGVPTWIMRSPWGVVRLILGQDRLILTTAADLHPLWARAAPSTDAVLASADLAALGRAYLPLLYARIPAGPQWLPGQDFPRAIARLNLLSGESVAGQIVQGEARSVGELITAGHTIIGGQMRDDLRTQLGMDGPAQIDDALALFTNWHSGTSYLEATHLLLFRLDDGWHVASLACGGLPTPAMTLPQAQARVAGLRQISGAPLARLRVIPIPTLATFDRRWLPDIAVLCDHLPAWHLVAHGTADGVVVEERGIPFLALLNLQPILRTTAHAPATPATTAPSRPRSPSAPPGTGF